ncbi:MAG: HD domain-containing phosphohydrolase [Eubacteriales bacterium]|jgi:HD-GYP domain-containing protein (c-di-GMP phosphodiesterase class II)
MIYLPIELLKPGMVVARAVESYSDSFSLPLLNKGQILTDSIIRRLVSRNIHGCFIDTDFTKDIEPGCIIAPALKKKTISGVKKVFDEVLVEKKVSKESMRLVLEISEELVLQILENEELLIDFIDLQNYDNYTYRHSLSVAVFSIAIGHKLQYSTSLLMQLATSALLHDLGKTDVPIEIINKPGRLTEEEYEIIKQHPQMAVNRLKEGGHVSDLVLNSILNHHERYNGTGYPKGLSEIDIPVYGRILAVADVYDALTSFRPYRRPWYPDAAIDYIRNYKGIYFDPAIVDVFTNIVVPYPVGTMVELSNGCPAIVIRNNVDKMRPVLRMFNVDDDTPFREVDLMNDAEFENIRITSLGYNSNIVDYNSFIVQPEMDYDTGTINS